MKVKVLIMLFMFMLNINKIYCQSCSYCDKIDVGFYVNLDNHAYTTCRDASKSKWSSSSTPYDFAYCRTNINCSNYNANNCGGTCVRANKFCQAALNYCNQLGGYLTNCQDN